MGKTYTVKRSQLIATAVSDLTSGNPQGGTVLRDAIDHINKVGDGPMEDTVLAAFPALWAKLCSVASDAAGGDPDITCEEAG